MARSQTPPLPPPPRWFTARPLREGLRAVAMNADGAFVGYTGAPPRALGWRRLNASGLDLAPMDIPGNGFGSQPYAIADDGTIAGLSTHPPLTERPYLWTPTRGVVAVTGLNDNHAPITAVATASSRRLLAGNQGNRAYVVADDRMTLLPLPDRATRSAAHAVRLLDWTDNRGVHRDQVVAGSVTFADGPTPALWYRDEGSPLWRVALTRGSYGMAGELLQSVQVGDFNFAGRLDRTQSEGDRRFVSVVHYAAVGYATIAGRKRAACYHYTRDDQTLNGSRLPQLAAGHESVAHAEILNRGYRSFTFGRSGDRATLWESGHGPGGATVYPANGDVEGMRLYDLNAIVALPPQASLTEAVSVSKTGLVLCNGVRNGAPWAFLLEPTAAGRAHLNLGP